MLRRPVVIASTALLMSIAAGCGASEASLVDASPVDAAPADASPVDAAPADAALPDPIGLAPGEVAEAPVTSGVASLRLATPAGSERFILVVASTDLASAGRPYAYRVEARATALPGAAARLTGCSLSSARWSAMVPPAESPPAGVAPAIGATRSFRMPTETAIESITARVVAVSDHAVLWADLTPAHPATVDPAVVTAVLRDFEATILPRERVVFGVESDVDGDGRVALVFSPVTARSGDAFFWQCDLLASPGCGESNRAEAIYLTPLDLIRPPYNTVTALDEIVAHEVGHLIHFGRKVLRNRLSAWVDSAYMSEGIGHLAQDAIGFQGDNLYATKIALDAIGEFSLGELFTDDTAYDLRRDAPMRGGAYLFARWLYDRAGGDAALPGGTVEGRGGPALLRALLDAPTSVTGSLPGVSGAAAADLAMDFYTALAASNRDREGGAAPANECFRYRPVALDPTTGRPRGADLFTTFDGMAMRGPATQPLAAADGELLRGGVEYLVVEPTAGQRDTAVTVRADAAARLRVRAVRVR
jgi:hypothetical protein